MFTIDCARYLSARFTLKPKPYISPESSLATPPHSHPLLLRLSFLFSLLSLSVFFLNFFVFLFSISVSCSLIILTTYLFFFPFLCRSYSLHFLSISNFLSHSSSFFHSVSFIFSLFQFFSTSHLLNEGSLESNCTSRKLAASTLQLLSVCLYVCSYICLLVFQSCLGLSSVSKIVFVIFLCTVCLFQVCHRFVHPSVCLPLCNCLSLCSSFIPFFLLPVSLSISVSISRTHF